MEQLREAIENFNESDVVLKEVDATKDQLIEILYLLPHVRRKAEMLLARLIK
jgi:hypothetical protein